MPKIRIERVGGLSDRLQPYKIIIDGAKCGTIAAGQVVSLNITPGIHSVRFEVGRYSSVARMVHVGEATTVLYCRANKRRFFGLLFFFAPHARILTSVKEDADVPDASSHPQPAYPEDRAIGSTMPKAYLKERMRRSAQPQA